ncbi:hypothetical protein JY98_03860 [Exiguobacterium mexicanum]|nr:hypothetical protein JY98_03860 [Exiguobacterium mexicanum]
MWWNYVEGGVHFLYEVAGIGLGIGLLLSIRQLKLLKEDFDNRRKRAAAEKSIENMYTYADKILNVGHPEYLKSLLANKQDDSLDARGRRFFEKHFDEHGFDFIITDKHSDELQDALWRQQSGITTVLNHLELYSISMIHGVADEEIAFTPTSHHFCDFIKDNYTGITMSRQRNVPFENTIRLFEKWDSRIKVNELKRRQEQLMIETKVASFTEAGLTEQSKRVNHL